MGVGVIHEKCQAVAQKQWGTMQDALRSCLAVPPGAWRACGAAVLPPAQGWGTGMAGAPPCGRAAVGPGAACSSGGCRRVAEGLPSAEC